MGAVRIRWRGVARVAAIVLFGLVAVRLLPGLLRAPEPPPLAADVGLPKVAPVVAPVADAAPHTRTRPRRPRRKPHPRPVRDAPAASAVIGSHRKPRIERHREHLKRRSHKPLPAAAKAPESPPPPPHEYAPPPAPAPIPEPLPEPEPAPAPTPDDGSEEFAPH
jgi:hypothetical protein